MAIAEGGEKRKKEDKGGKKLLSTFCPCPGDRFRARLASHQLFCGCISRPYPGFANVVSLFYFQDVFSPSMSSPPVSPLPPRLPAVFIRDPLPCRVFSVCVGDLIAGNASVPRDPVYGRGVPCPHSVLASPIISAAMSRPGARDWIPGWPPTGRWGW